MEISGAGQSGMVYLYDLSSGGVQKLYISDHYFLEQNYHSFASACNSSAEQEQ
jgi:hypothetical protein